MSGVSQTERKALRRSLEHNNKLANERFGYMMALKNTLGRFLTEDAVKEAMVAARNRDFEEFEKITSDITPR
ncbi:hypothetical protein [Photobacterium damselae]|uniref:hypothetical protein n=1 Tax=Photobacterium damselae TaxID=38293 RepID=UPI001F1A2F86|nr:hypothetical protein [Photobacterium damselae]UKA04816.1 hypothetical protein IHC89_21475 [Photobacterium damselae subsp. damselae]